MDLKLKLHQFRDKYQTLGRDLEKLLKEYDSNMPANENLALRKENAEFHQEIEKLRRELDALSQEKDRLYMALKEQIFNEKLNLVKVSRAKMETYFGEAATGYHDRLTELSLKMRIQLNQLKHITQRDLLKDKDLFEKKIDDLAVELDQKIREQFEEYRKKEQELLKEFRNETDKLASTEVTPEVIRKRAKQNQWELKIGLNWINKLGIVLILLGIGAAFQYTYAHWMNDYMKAGCIFLLGALFLIAGEWFYRKKQEVFSTGLLGGGVSILYGAIFYSYFLLKIIGLNLGLSLAVLVTLTTIVLSLRYNSATISSLGLIGGFLPFLTFVMVFGLEGNAFLTGMGYLLLLNASLLIISLFKQWQVVQYLSFLLNVPALIYLVFTMKDIGIGIIYSMITFGMYLAAALAYPIKHRITLKAPGVVLLGLNTFISCLVLFSLFGKAGLNQYHGLMAVLFCLIYIGVGQIVRFKLPEENKALILFYATALTFAVLIIPFQFGVSWLSLGWLVEAVCLIIYGSKNKLCNLEWAGWGIFILCFGAFVIGEYFPAIFKVDSIKYFEYKYLAIIAGQILILFNYLLEIKKNRISSLSSLGRIITGFKYFTIVCVWFYLLYMGTWLYRRLVTDWLNSYFYYTTLIAALTIGLGYLVSKLKILYDKVVRGMVTAFYIFADLLCLGLNLFYTVLDSDLVENGPLDYLALIILILFNVFLFLNLKDLIIMFLKRKGYSLELYPLTIAVFLLGNITVFLLVQFHLGSINLLFSFVYLLLAIGFIGYGFWQKFIYIRRFGLGLTLFAIAKLFIYDLSFLEIGWKILAYFGFGLVLLLISYIYQKVKINMEGFDVTKNI